MPSWRDLRRFCENDGWELYKQTNHLYYRKRLANGDVLYTKVSFGSKQIHYQLWHQILKRQLQVTQEYFNDHL